MDRAVGREVPHRTRRDAVDLIFTLTSYPVFRLLSNRPRPHAVAVQVKQACRDALARGDQNRRV